MWTGRGGVRGKSGGGVRSRHVLRQNAAAAWNEGSFGLGLRTSECTFLWPFLGCSQQRLVTSAWRSRTHHWTRRSASSWNHHLVRSAKEALWWHCHSSRAFEVSLLLRDHVACVSQNKNKFQWQRSAKEWTNRTETSKGWRGHSAHCYRYHQCGGGS